MGAVGVTEGVEEDGDLLLIKLVLLIKSGVDFFSPLYEAFLQVLAGMCNLKI